MNMRSPFTIKPLSWLNVSGKEKYGRTRGDNWSLWGGQPFWIVCKSCLASSFVSVACLISCRRWSGMLGRAPVFLACTQCSYEFLCVGNALLNGSANTRLRPGTYWNVISYLCNRMINACKRFGAWLKVFLRMNSKGLWLLCTTTLRP